MEKKDILVLSLATIIGAAAGLYIAVRKKSHAQETPPKEAPQLDIQNPGEQSEFLTSPTEETELG